MNRFYLREFSTLGLKRVGFSRTPLISRALEPFCAFFRKISLTEVLYGWKKAASSPVCSLSAADAAHAGAGCVSACCRLSARELAFCAISESVTTFFRPFFIDLALTGIFFRPLWRRPEEVKNKVCTAAISRAVSAGEIKRESLVADNSRCFCLDLRPAL